MSVDQFEEAKEANQKMKIQQWTNKRKLVESWRYGYLGSSLQKIESRVLIDKGAVMIVHVLSGWLASYPIRRVFLQHISLRVSVESVINKRKSSCHFAWRNASDIGLKCHCLRKCSRGQKLWSTDLAETCHRSWVQWDISKANLAHFSDF